MLCKRMHTEPAAISVRDIQDVAFRIKDELPSSHTFTRIFRGSRFRKAVEKFADLFYRIELRHFQTVEQFEMIEKLTQFVVGTIELHVVSQYTTRDTVECVVFRDILEKLRVGLDGLRQGLPPDPAKRPTDGDLEQLANDRLSKVMKIPQREHAPA